MVTFSAISVGTLSRQHRNSQYSKQETSLSSCPDATLTTALKVTTGNNYFLLFL